MTTIGMITAQAGPETQAATAMVRTQLGNAGFDIYEHERDRDPSQNALGRSMDRLSGLAIVTFDPSTRQTWEVDDHTRQAAVTAARRGVPLFAQTLVTPAELGVTYFTGKVTVFGTTDTLAIRENLEDHV